MATIKRSLSTRTDVWGRSEVFLRLSVSRSLVMRIKSGVFVNPVLFNEEFSVMTSRVSDEDIVNIRKAEERLRNIEQFLIHLCSTTRQEALDKDLIMSKFETFCNPSAREKEAEEPDFFEVFETFIAKKNISIWRIKHLRVLKRAIMRFELYKRTSGRKYRVRLSKLTVEDINEFEIFLRSEHLLYKKYPAIYNVVPADTHSVRKKPKPQPKGDNTIVGLFALLRAFYRWCRDQELTTNDPFAKYTGKTTERYGTPYYITMEERDIIADYDLTSLPSLEAQRDIFIFQCLIGCRVSDLLAMTPASVINGAIEYMPQKTKGERPQVVRVPLNNRAKAIIEKYADRDNLNGKLLPFISSQKYNEAIKKVFMTCGITRAVTVLNPTTGEEEKRPINEIASSHLARRTFIGNLYKKVKDPNLVGSLSGHKEGSKAFARYRDIDEEMKKELVSLLD